MQRRERQRTEDDPPQPRLRRQERSTQDAHELGEDERPKTRPWTPGPPPRPQAAAPASRAESNPEMPTRTRSPARGRSQRRLIPGSRQSRKQVTPNARL